MYKLYKNVKHFCYVHSSQLQQGKSEIEGATCYNKAASSSLFSTAAGAGLQQVHFKQKQNNALTVERVEYGFIWM